MTDTLIFILGGTLAAATSILLAALGEMVAERAGVLNLSVEGMMATGAAVGFTVVTLTGSHALGFLAAGLAAAVLSLVFAALVLAFQANQVASGLAVGVLGLGVSAFVGKPLEGATVAKLAPLPLAGLPQLPVIGPILFSHDALVYLGIALVPALAVFFRRSKLGLKVRAVGENPEAARALGIPVAGLRLACILFGAFLAGAGGAHLAVASTGLWAEGLVAGRGWIAVAMVVFGGWLPLRIALGAFVFGAMSLLELSVQGLGLAIPSQLLSASPYLVTIAVLAFISRDQARLRLTRPLALGKTYRHS